MPEAASWHLVAARGERARGEGAHRLLVLDQQDRGAAGQVGDLGGRLGVSLAGFSPSAGMWRGTKMRKIVPLPSSLVEVDVAAGLLDDAVDGGEAEARALADLLGGEERLEDLAPAPPAVMPVPVSSTSIST